MAATGQVETNLHVHIGRKNALKKVVNLLELYLQVKTQKQPEKRQVFMYIVITPTLQKQEKLKR